MTALFRLIFSSDPQYPWYDGLLPEGLRPDQQTANAERQISQQYESMNALATEHPGVAGVLINGDLTAFGQPWQLCEYRRLLGRLKLPCYPGLGKVADCDLTQKRLTVSQRFSSGLDGDYRTGDSWECGLYVNP